MSPQPTGLETVEEQRRRVAEGPNQETMDELHRRERARREEQGERQRARQEEQGERNQKLVVEAHRRAAELRAPTASGKAAGSGAYSGKIRARWWSWR
jgi:hypothetical protein